MRAYEFLLEDIGKEKRGMLVQTLDQFVKSKGIKPSYNKPLDEDNEEKPIYFNPKARAQYSPEIPEKPPKSDAPRTGKDSYSRVVSPQELADFLLHKEGYGLYYKGRKLNTTPIHPSIKQADKIMDGAMAEVEKMMPEATNKEKKEKVYQIFARDLKKFIKEESIKNNTEIKQEIASENINIRQITVDKFVKEGKKLDMPAIHGSAVPIVDENGEIIYDLDSLAKLITTRPKELLKVNAKMQKSGLTTVTMANIGIPAISGLVVDEDTNEFRIVSTCPGAGICKSYCYATRGGYVQYVSSFQSQARILNFWFNDPEAFKQQVITEVKSITNKDSKTYIRWHDSGDFFDDAYLNLAFDVARAVPNATFYAYTKIASVAKSNMPENFVINFSQGATKEQSSQIDITTTKHSAVVDKDLFYAPDTGIGLKNLKDGDSSAINKMKEVIADHYNLDINTILSYNEMLNIPEKGKKPHYNVFIIPGKDGDLAAARRDVLGSYLLYH